MNIEAIKKFVLAGNSYFTIKNNATGNRFTYRVSAAKDRDGNSTERRFVSVLTRPDNEGGYTYAGLIDNRGFRLTKGSKIGKDAMSVKAFDWFFNNRVSCNTDLPESVEFFHEGRCGKCGRKLTTPESVTAGFGPECIKTI